MTPTKPSNSFWIAQVALDSALGAVSISPEDRQNFIDEYGRTPEEFQIRYIHPDIDNPRMDRGQYFVQFQPGATHFSGGKHFSQQLDLLSMTLIDVVMITAGGKRTEALTVSYEDTDRPRTHRVKLLDQSGSLVAYVSYANVAIKLTESDLPNDDWTISMTVQTVDVAYTDAAHRDNPTNQPKEHRLMKPDSMKKSSIAKHPEVTATTTAPGSWHHLLPVLILGKTALEVDLMDCSEEEISKLRNEWFWLDARNTKLPRTPISLTMALDSQDRLIDMAKSFIGVYVYHSKGRPITSHLPIRDTDDLAMTLLLDGSFWEEVSVEYPSVIEEWLYGPDKDDHRVVKDVHTALLMQKHFSMIDGVEPAVEPIPAPRKSRGKGKVPKPTK